MCICNIEVLFFFLYKIDEDLYVFNVFANFWFIYMKTDSASNRKEKKIRQ